MWRNYFTFNISQVHTVTRNRKWKIENNILLKILENSKFIVFYNNKRAMNLSNASFRWFPLKMVDRSGIMITTLLISPEDKMKKVGGESMTYLLVKFEN